MSDQTTVDPTRHMTRSIALVFCCLILSITGYCTTEILMNPDRCTKDVADITENCIIRADGDNEPACIQASVEMMKTCASKRAPKN